MKRGPWNAREEVAEGQRKGTTIELDNGRMGGVM